MCFWLGLVAARRAWSCPAPATLQDSRCPGCVVDGCQHPRDPAAAGRAQCLYHCKQHPAARLSPGAPTLAASGKWPPAPRPHQLRVPVIKHVLPRQHVLRLVEEEVGGQPRSEVGSVLLLLQEVG